jgi:hypothetical protein
MSRAHVISTLGGKMRRGADPPAGATRGEVADFWCYLICRARGMSHTRMTIPSEPAMPIAATAPRAPAQ